jgi:EmrB/QacA subfamily drug resistance transporter
VAIALGAMGAILGTLSVTVALQDLSVDLHADLGSVQWVVTGYLLGIVAVIPATAWLTRRFGARQLYLTTLVLFTVASLLCVFAQTIEMLVALRVLQGLAGGATLPVGQMILAGLAGPERMGRVMSISGVPMLLVPVFAPAIGGLLVEQLSWHWIFLMNVPLTLAALVLGYRVLPRRQRRDPGPFDVLGFALLCAGAPTFVYGLAVVVAESRLTSAGAVPAATGLVLVAAFTWHARRGENALLDTRLWRRPAYAACAITGLLVSASLFGTQVILLLYFQTTLGAGPLDAGLMLMPMGISTVIALTVAGRLADRFGGGPVALASTILLFLATAPLIWVGEGTPYGVLCILLAIRGVASGGALTPALAVVFATLETRHLPDATPQMNLMQRSGQAIGTAILSVVSAGQLAHSPGAGAVDFGPVFIAATAIAATTVIPAAALARVLAAERRRVTSPT